MKIIGIISQLTIQNLQVRWMKESNKTFYAEEYSEKITQHTISKIFDNKFRATKYAKVTRDQDKIQHQTTVYKLDKSVAEVLSKKYGIAVPLNSPLYAGQHSQQGQQTDDHVNQVDQVSEEKLFR